MPLCRYHPIGFAYIAGGAHTSCKDTNGVAGECPELGGEAAGTTIQYYVGGVAVTSDESGFGLDAYEPLFFNSQGWWGEQTAFNVTLAIPADATYTRIYYFCHIHAGMSAEIEITGSTAITTTVINVAALGGETEATALAVFTGSRHRTNRRSPRSTRRAARMTLLPLTLTQRTPPARARTSSAVLAPTTPTPNA